MGVGEGLGEPLPDWLDEDGLGEGDGEVGGVDEPPDVGDGDGDGDVAEGFGDGEDLQDGEAFGDELPPGIGPPPPYRRLECLASGPLLLELPPATGLLLLAARIRAGGPVAMAKDRPATTRNAAASPAAGRSHLTNPLLPSSGRKRSM
ncbi:MAG: hypothetical protein ACTHJW_05080 [Streptosporangiaceae bacterium]